MSPTLKGKDLNHLFHKYSQELRIYLTRQVGCPHIACDLAQEALLKVSSQQGEGVVIGNTRAYLYRTARNLAIDHFRKEERRNTVPTDLNQLADIPDESPQPDELISTRERLDLLLRAVNELPFLTRRIFALNRLDGLSYTEVARQLEISESTVQKHLATALLHAMQSVSGKV